MGQPFSIPYTGIGSRTTPPEICEEMTRIARYLSSVGFKLRSGGAPGADSAFEAGAGEDCDIFIPWRGFENRSRGILITGAVHERAAKIAALHHPAWSRLSHGAAQLHIRNVPQVLGKDLISPSKFVICWTPDGKASGGTGQALRIADAYDVKVFNLFTTSARFNLRETVKHLLEIKLKFSA